MLEECRARAMMKAVHVAHRALWTGAAPGALRCRRGRDVAAPWRSQPMRGAVRRRPGAGADGDAGCGAGRRCLVHGRHRTRWRRTGGAGLGRSSPPPLALRRSGAKVHGMGSCGRPGYLAVPAVVLAALLFPSGRCWARPAGSRRAGGAARHRHLSRPSRGLRPRRLGLVPMPRQSARRPEPGSAGYPELADRLVAGDMARCAAGFVGFAATPTSASVAGCRRLSPPPSPCSRSAGSWPMWSARSLGGRRCLGGRGTRDAALAVLPALYVAGYAAQRPSRARVADLLLAAREEHARGAPRAGRPGDR